MAGIQVPILSKFSDQKGLNSNFTTWIVRDDTYLIVDRSQSQKCIVKFRSRKFSEVLVMMMSHHIGSFYSIRGKNVKT